MASTISFGNANSGFQAGTIKGPVHAEFHHHALERPETPPNPSVVIPFGRDADFVNRGIILDQIHQKCAVLGSRTALVGLGGVGKSQLAIEYAYQTQNQSPKPWVFWLHASNAARFEQSFRDIANSVKISGRNNPKANIFQLVHDWLRDDRKGKWILILDNVDDAGFLVNAQSTGQDGQTNGIGSGNLQPLVAYLPQCPNGSILITTRSKSTALQLVEQRNIILVEPMGRSDALALLERKLGWHNNDDDAVELATELEFMPLAIVQAAAYISYRVPRYSVQEYLQDFRKSDRKRTSLLNYEGGQLRRDWEAKNSIIITWQISFDHIREIRPSAADLLSLMCFFDRQGIPEALLRSQGDRRNSRQAWKERNDDHYATINASHSDDEEDKISQSSVIDGFEDDILALRNYSFISVNTDGTTFEMHGLVQLATRKWLEAHKQQERWKQQFIKNLHAELPTGEYENWVRCQTLFPHAKSAVAQQPEEQDSLRDWTSILFKAAWYAWRMGKGVEAEKLSVQAMKVRKRVLGQEHNDTLDSMELAGLAYDLRGQWDAAEELFVQVMEMSEKKLGVGHLDTLISMAHLASTYRNQGRWKEAEDLEVQVMETRKRVLGQEHPGTLSSMANLASTFSNQGRWKEAEDLEVQVMQTSSTVLGPEHPDTLASMGNLASTYRNQGRWKEAEDLFVQVVETSLRVLGQEHPFTLTSMANLASTYRNQGHWKEAEDLDVQTVEKSLRVLGQEHPDTLISMGNLALTYQNQGRWKEAEDLGAQVMETRKRVLGQEHPYTLTSMNNLAFTYRDQGRWKEAEDLFVQVVETSLRVLGQEHPDTLASMANLAATYRNQGRWEEAEDLQVQVMETFKRVLGQEHPSMLNSMANLASTFWNQGRWKEAEDLFVQVMETRKRVLGQENPDTLSSMANLASTFSNQGRWKEAEDLEVQVMQTRKRVLGHEHPDTLTGMANLASTYRNQGRWKKAEDLDVQVVKTFKRVLGHEHPDTLTSMANLASTYRNQKRWKEAEDLNVQVMETRKRVLGQEHPDTLTSMNNLAFVWKGLGQDNEALKLMEQCVALRSRIIGTDHPHTLSSYEALLGWQTVSRLRWRSLLARMASAIREHL